MINDRISLIALIYPVFRSFEMVNDYDMYIISNVGDNQVHLTINMVVNQASFHLLEERFLSATKWYKNIRKKHWPHAEVRNILFTRHDF